ncbi:MAG: DUF3040 domain-containing protein [Microthrixaceae bacterium]|nr:DUF3040 domain-containing protein [Microthrixaceae bacterium]MCO5318046.1 DUF3040 domain-containing protein [Microthrixaceae bacterium]
MPLSEDEQRILSEIESQLRESDPDLAEEVSRTTVYRDAFSKLRWAVAGFVVFLGVSVLLLSVNYLLAFVGFLGMFAMAMYIERNLRRVGKAGIDEATRAFRRNSLRDYLDSAGNRARERLRRDDEES